MKKSELQTVTDIIANINSATSSSVTNTVQDFAITTSLSTDKIDDDTTTPDEILAEQDKNTGSSIGNVESASISSVEFVDIVSGK